MNDRSAVQRVNVMFAFEDLRQDELRDALSLRYVEAAVPDAQFLTSRFERKAESYHFDRL